MNTKNFDQNWLNGPLTVQYFYIGSDLCGVLMALMIFEIHWLITITHLVVYCSIQSFFTFKLYGLISNDFILLCVFIGLIVGTDNYRGIRTSKISFIQGKKIKQLLNEQQKIF